MQKDLIQEGYVGLLKAKKSFNPAFKVKFITYAYPYIKRYMVIYLNKNSKKMETSLTEDLSLDYCDLENIDYDSIEYLIEDCSEKCKEIIYLILKEHLTEMEIAKKMGVSKASVSYILSKGKDIIYKKIKNNF